MNDDEQETNVIEKMDYTNDESPDCTYPPLQLDPSRYRDTLDGLETSEVTAEEVMEIVWKIVQCSVEIGFGGNPIQLLFGPFMEKSLEDGPGQGKLEVFNKKAKESVTGEAQ